MLRRLTFTVLLLAATPSAFAGIIGMGGSPTITSEELSQKLDAAEEVPVDSDKYRRLDIRLSTQPTVVTEIQNNKNEKEVAEFTKVYLNTEPSIVETSFRLKLKAAP